MLTNVQDLDIKIVNMLNDRDLANYFQTNRTGRSLSKLDSFWLKRLLTKFPYLNLSMVNKYKGDRSWKQYYTSLTKIKPNNITEDDLLDRVEEGRLDYIIVLDNEGYDVHEHDELILRVACRWGQLDIVKYLVERGADIHTRVDEAIVSASDSGNLNLVKYLVSQGADSSAWVDEPLMLAIEQDNFSLVKYLVEQNGANVRAQEDAGIWIAIRHENMEIVEYLVDKGIGVEIEELEDAVRQNTLEIIKYLISHLREIGHGPTLLQVKHLIRLAKEYQYMEIVDYLMTLLLI